MIAPVCVWKEDERSATGCGAPATDEIVFEPEARSMFPDPRVPVCSKHYSVCSSWIGANLGRVVGSTDPGDL